MNKRFVLLLLPLLMVIILVSCSGSGSGPAGEWTGITELDQVIRIVLSHDADALRSLIEYTRAQCTNQDGLGGPPKCREGEPEGKLLEVLPFLGPEGHFLRKEEIEGWEGLEVRDLYAVYEVSPLAFDDPFYPRGNYALVFIHQDPETSVTIQVKQGKILRIDYGFGFPPQIPAGAVEEYLLAPQPVE